VKKISLLLIMALAFFLRLYRLDNPVADWHSWRQADTSSVSRRFVQEGFDLLHPKFHDLSRIPSDHENPEGHRFVELPIYNFFQAGAFKLLPFFSLEVWGRLVSIIASLGAMIFLYLIVKKYSGAKTAWWAAFFYAVLPFNVYYSRTILPESMMNMAWLGMIYFFDQWISCSLSPISHYLLPAILFAASAFLLKPYTLVFLLPIAYLAWRQWRLDQQKWFTLVLCLFVSLAPLVLWRWWMQRYPEGIPLSLWLYGHNIRLKGAFFWWLFAQRIGKLILGFWGLIPLGIGLALKPKPKEGWFFYTWIAAILFYFFYIAGGNIQHDYYQVMIVPVICVFLAKGAHFLMTAPSKFFSRSASRLLLITCLLFTLAFSWYQIRDFFNINNPIIAAAGEAANQLLPADAKVIAPYGGDTAFLYQTKRQGWPVGIEIEQMINRGAQYYVNVNFDVETEWVMANWCVLQKTDQWVIVDLTKKSPCK